MAKHTVYTLSIEVAKLAERVAKLEEQLAGTRAPRQSAIKWKDVSPKSYGVPAEVRAAYFAAHPGTKINDRGTIEKWAAQAGL